MGSRRSRNAGRKKASGADNFKLIENISTYLEAKLHRSGILTYAQLAALTPEEIIAAVGQSTKLTAERIQKEHWIRQARDLAGKKTMAQFVVQLVLNENRTVSSTKITHSESYEETDWVGWNESRLVSFIIKQGQLSIPAPARKVAARKAKTEETADKNTSPAQPVSESPAPASKGRPEERPPVPSPAALQEQIPVPPAGVPESPAVAQLREFATLSSDLRISSVLVAPERPFQVRLAFDLPGLATPPDERISYTTIVYAKSLGTSRRHSVGIAEGDVLPGEAVRLELQGKGLPAGIYRLEADLTLVVPTSQKKPAPQQQTRLKGSILQVG